MKKIALLLIVLLLFTACDENKLEEGTKEAVKVTATPEVTVTPEITATLDATATPDVTVTPEITATPEPTQEPTPEPIKAEIITKREYTKAVIIPDEYKDMEQNFQPHKVFVPEIIDDGDAVKALNDSIFAICNEYIDLLENNKEETYLINISYIPTEKDGIFGIILEERNGVMFSEWWSSYNFFYYDSVENKVLTEDEYYEKMGESKENIWNRIKSSPEFIMEQDFYAGASLQRAIFNEDVIFAVVNTPNGFIEQTFVQIAR